MMKICQVTNRGAVRALIVPDARATPPPIASEGSFATADERDEALVRYARKLIGRRALAVSRDEMGAGAVDTRRARSHSCRCENILR